MIIYICDYCKTKYVLDNTWTYFTHTDNPLTANGWSVRGPSMGPCDQCKWNAQKEKDGYLDCLKEKNKNIDFEVKSKYE